MAQRCNWFVIAYKGCVFIFESENKEIQKNLRPTEDAPITKVP